MPVSIVLHLGIASRAEPQRDIGRHIQGWFFHVLSERYSKDFATQLHGSNAYTLSGLFRQSKRFPGEYYARITSLSEQVSDFLLDEFSKVAPPVLNFGAHAFDLEGISVDKHPFAGNSSFQDLANPQAHTSDITLKFSSPTSFHSNGIDIPIPVPSLIFGSLMRKWNEHAPQPLRRKNNREFKVFLENNVMVSEMHDIRTSKWSLPKGGWDAAVGFEGGVQISIITRRKIEHRIERIDKRLKKTDSSEKLLASLVNEKELNELWLRNYKDFCLQIYTLAEYSFFSGVGHHTTIGMGQCRVLQQPMKTGPITTRNSRKSDLK